jgi:hypothetical protein
MRRGFAATGSTVLYLRGLSMLRLSYGVRRC